jgi:hypothetical protein
LESLAGNLRTLADFDVTVSQQKRLASHFVAERSLFGTGAGRVDVLGHAQFFGRCPGSRVGGRTQFGTHQLHPGNVDRKSGHDHA